MYKKWFASPKLISSLENTQYGKIAKAIMVKSLVNNTYIKFYFAANVAGDTL
jgi:hypothetical protein